MKRASVLSAHPSIRCDAALYGIPEKLFIIPLESRAAAAQVHVVWPERGREAGRGMQQQQHQHQLQTTQCAFVFVTYDIRHAHVEAREHGQGQHQNLRFSNLEESFGLLALAN